MALPGRTGHGPTMPASAARTAPDRIGEREFIALMAMMMALQALCIDAMLPALDEIARDLAVSDPNQRQLVVGVFLFSAGFGSLLPGFLADRYGRRRVLLVSFAAYIVLAVGCALVTSFTMLLLRRPDGAKWVITFVVTVAMIDTAGYLVGRKLGKHKLAPGVSPKKTWEGFIGSIIFTTVAGALAFHYILDAEMWIGALAGLLVVVSGTSGDLIESAIKRDLAIKDMGDLLPGHGGVLDRIDSILYAAPALWLALELVRHAQESGLL